MIDDVRLSQRIDVSRCSITSGTNRKHSIGATFPVIVRIENVLELMRRLAATVRLEEAYLTGRMPRVENRNQSIDFLQDGPAGRLSHARTRRQYEKVHRGSDDALISKVMFLCARGRVECDQREESRQF